MQGIFPLFLIFPLLHKEGQKNCSEHQNFDKVENAGGGIACWGDPASGWKIG